MVLESALVLNNSQSIYGYSDRQATQTWGVNSSTGSAVFGGGLHVGSNGISIDGSPSLTTPTLCKLPCGRTTGHSRQRILNLRRC